MERTPRLTLLPWLEAKALHGLVGDCEHCEAEAGWAHMDGGTLAARGFEGPHWVMVGGQILLNRWNESLDTEPGH